MKQRLELYSEGFISVYFLVLFLYIISILMTVTLMIENRLESVLYLKEANRLQNEEMIVFYDIRNKYIRGELEDTSYEIQSISYSVEQEDTKIYVWIEKEIEVYMCIYTKDNQILDYDVQRFLP